MYSIKYKTYELPPFFYAYYEIYNFLFFLKIKNYLGIQYLSEYILLYINKYNF